MTTMTTLTTFSNNPGHGKYGTWLKDGSEIIYRRQGGSWKIGTVVDDRIYNDTCVAVSLGEIYHVTYTGKDCIDFGINTDGMNSGHRDWEVFTPKMDGHKDFGKISDIRIQLLNARDDSIATVETPDYMVHLRVLGLASDASDADIKCAHHRLAIKYHPDKGGGVAQFQQMQAAYETLKSSEFGNGRCMKKRWVRKHSRMVGDCRTPK